MISSGPSEQVLGLRIRGPIEPTDIASVANAFEGKLERGSGPLRIYAEVYDVVRLSPSTPREDLRVSVRHFRDVEREAVVADPGWTASLAKIGDLLPGIELRHFSWEQRDEALKWINAGSDRPGHRQDGQRGEGDPAGPATCHWHVACAV